MSRQDDPGSPSGGLWYSPSPSKLYLKVCLDSLPRKGDRLACATFHGLPVYERLCNGSESNSVDTNTFLTLEGMRTSLW